MWSCISNFRCNPLSTCSSRGQREPDQSIEMERRDGLATPTQQQPAPVTGLPVQPFSSNARPPGDVSRQRSLLRFFAWKGKSRSRPDAAYTAGQQAAPTNTTAAASLPKSRQESPAVSAVSKSVHIPMPSLQTGSPMGQEAEGSRHSGSVGNRVFITRNGKEYPTIYTLPEDLRNRIRQHDPIVKYSLTDDSVFYRITEKKYLAQGRIAGNPESSAMITNHLAVMPNPRPRAMAKELSEGWSSMTEEQRKELQELIDRNPSHIPVTMFASDLPDYSLNVAHGERALEFARRYEFDSVDDMAVIKMTLGDFRRAGGGAVFEDHGGSINMKGTRPLIVTLPEGATIPVEIVEVVPARIAVR